MTKTLQTRQFCTTVLNEINPQGFENFFKACFRTHLKIAQNKHILLLITFLPVKSNRRKLSRKLFLWYY